MRAPRRAPLFNEDVHDWQADDFDWQSVLTWVHLCRLDGYVLIFR